MLEKDKLRKTDVFSGGLIFVFGLWVISQALQMPMKDSWGGVQNVWFVSPALLPLFVGAMIAILGLLLSRTAIKSVGGSELGRVLRWLASPALLAVLKSDPAIRFYAMAVLLFSFVFLNLPRIDFFLCSVLFLAVFISMFYFDDDALLRKLLRFYLAGTAVLGILVGAGLTGALRSTVPYPADWLVLAFIVAYQVYARWLIRGRPELKRQYRLSLILAIVPPFLIGSIFKYFLLVPMPTEGLVTALLDAIRYWEF